MSRDELVSFLSEQLDAYLIVSEGYQEGVAGGELLLTRLEEKLGIKLSTEEQG